MFKFLAWLLGIDQAPKQSQPQLRPTNTNSVMDEGDYHSGPYGYTPNTAYPETQYGSGFDEEAEWYEEEH